MLSIDDPVRFGIRVEEPSSIDLASGVVTITPVGGWTLLASAPLRIGSDAEGRAELVDDAVSISVRTHHFDGSPDELLARIVGPDDVSARPSDISVDRRDVVARGGVRGVVEHRLGSDDDYVVAAFCFRVDPGSRGVGVEFVAEGTWDSLMHRLEVLHAMIASIGP